jgi:hypothetical protein
MYNKTMRRIILYIAIFFTAAVFSGLAQQPVREEVKVVNVEIPVRVFYKGHTVNNLSRNDFKLYEDKKLQDISSFNIVRKRIKVPDSNITKPRYFVLVFRVYNYNRQFREGVRYIFDNITVKNDSLLILANNKSMFIDSVDDKEKALSRVEKLLSEQAQSARGQMISYLKRIEQEVDMRSFKQSLRQPEFIKIQEFLRKYLRVWKDYKGKYLLPNLNRYYYFARQLESIKKEKWVINFYQMEMLPNIIISGEMKREINRFSDNLMESTSAEGFSYGKILRTLMNEIKEKTNIALEFPVDDISKLFYKVNATFFTIFIRTTIGIESQDHESMKIISDMENCLRDITRAAGGALLSTSDIKQAVDKIGNEESVCYLLTYAPENPQKIGKIKIKVNKKRHNVIYDDNMRADYIKEYLEKIGKQSQSPSIRIKDLYLKEKKLCVSLDNFLLKKTEKGPVGQIGIHICVKTDKGAKIFDKGKPLMPQKDIVTISIPFKGLKKGTYDFVVSVRDFLTGKTDRRSIRESIK